MRFPLTAAAVHKAHELDHPPVSVGAIMAMAAAERVLDAARTRLEASWPEALDVALAPINFQPVEFFEITGPSTARRTRWLTLEEARALYPAHPIEGGA